MRSVVHLHCGTVSGYLVQGNTRPTYGGHSCEPEDVFPQQQIALVQFSKVTVRENIMRPLQLGQRT